jgi:N-acyl-D-glutamate deacylase
MDADVVVFDPRTVADAGTYEEPNRISRGIVHVLVGGRAVVRHGILVEGSHPGQWLRSTGGIP